MQVIKILFLLISVAFAGCANWALQKYSEDYESCMKEASDDILLKRQCLRNWKLSLGDTDCADTKFKNLFSEFCNGLNGGSSICEFI